MKKVLIISYYWPPSGGSGVQRWLKFSKFLPKYGIKPYVYTPKNPTIELIDNELTKQISNDVTVWKKKIYEPYSIKNMFSKKSKKTETSGVISNSKFGFIFNWIRGNFFIPDPKVLWIKPSINYLEKKLTENSIDTIISTGPPHSMHLIALALKNKLNLKWIADFRDPWSNFVQNKFLNKLESTRIKHENKENLVLKFSDAILTTSKSLNKEFKLKNHNTFYTPSGFESFIKPKAYNKFRILYAGSMKEFQNPINLWIALKELIESDISFKDLVEIVLIGNIDKNIIENKEFRLLQNTKIISYLSKDNLDKEISISELLLVCSVNVEGSNDIIPGKFYHYLSSGKKILGISNRGTDLEKIIKETKSGMSFSYDNHADLKNYIYKCFSDYKDGKVNNQKTDDKSLSLNIAKNISEIISKL